MTHGMDEEHTMSQRPSTGRVVRTATVAALLPVALMLGACASGGSSGAPGSTPVAQQGNGSNGNGSNGNGSDGNGSDGNGSDGGQRRGLPGASGLIAAASPGILQVQSTDSQTTVTYSASTRFSQVVTAAVAVGDCVVVTGAPATGSSTALTATSVRIEARVDGACPTATGRAGTGGFGGGEGGGNGGGNGGANGFPNGAPSGVPSFPGGGARPSGAPSGSFPGRDFAFATGSVTAVQGSTVTVQGVLRAPRARASASPSPQPTTPTSITVMLSSDTTVTKTVAATSKVAVVGVCATAIGKANDRGDIAATSVTVSKPDATTGCRTTGGSGFFGGGAGSGGGGGSTGGSGSSA